MTSSPTDAFGTRLRDIQARIATAATESGRAPADVTLLAVSKRHPDSAVTALLALGVTDFGENVVQAWRARRHVFTDSPPHWHLIGPLQTNKARFVAADLPTLVHTIDRPSVVNALQKKLVAQPRALDVLLQVNIDAEPQKSGCALADVDALADTIAAAPTLRLRGLMCLPKPGSIASIRAAFARTHALLGRVSDRVKGCPVLSMGTSNDFEAAIAEGATIVRVGTALFGSR